MPQLLTKGKLAHWATSKGLRNPLRVLGVPTLAVKRLRGPRSWGVEGGRETGREDGETPPEGLSALPPTRRRREADLVRVTASSITYTLQLV